MTEQSASCCSPAADHTGGAKYGWRTIGRRGRFLIVAIAAAGGLYLNWGWAVAIGLAPILIAIAPCAIMCGLGICMMGGVKNRSAKPNAPGVPNPADQH
ncbi:MAG: hypothetical protein ABIV25_14605 [Paracoccaceae bacterium]